MSAEACRGEVAAGKTGENFLARLREIGILGLTVAHDRARLITHRDVSTEMVDEAIERLGSLAG